ncbi:ribosomal maturation YjgA family protein [Dyadobacter diqingensis]|uniref:ribosomal maturation YjgA family protein n=1 Tax=Dyadobacter diqingensis TaxID=2938121 RepID=UPI0020C42EDF|nr:DUF2809 domain-containing protein [Dyadobacter diqingensis]
MQKDTFSKEKNLLRPDAKTSGRNRITYFFLTILTIALGLTSRKMADQFPKLVNLYLGDALWALMIFLIAGFLFNKHSTLRTTLYSAVFCYLIEISQLYHAPWIDAIRATTPGALVLGYGFLWSDILAYSIGIGVGLFLEKLLLKNR